MAVELVCALFLSPSPSSPLLCFFTKERGRTIQCKRRRDLNIHLRTSMCILCVKGTLNILQSFSLLLHSLAVFSFSPILPFSLSLCSSFFLSLSPSMCACVAWRLGGTNLHVTLFPAFHALARSHCLSHSRCLCFSCISSLSFFPFLSYSPSLFSLPALPPALPFFLPPFPLHVCVCACVLQVDRRAT